MSGGTRISGPGRLQCNLCLKWFKPAGLGGHKRFFHGLWKHQLRDDLINLMTQVHAQGRMPKDWPSVDMGLGTLDEGQLQYWKERLHAILARVD